jgi:hypothetical protein
VALSQFKTRLVGAFEVGNEAHGEYLAQLDTPSAEGSILLQDRPQHCPRNRAVAHDIQDLRPLSFAGEQYQLCCRQGGLAELYRDQGQPRQLSSGMSEPKSSGRQSARLIPEPTL